MTKGYSSGNGGGLINSGLITVRNVTFLDNHAAGRGGGIQNYGSTPTVENSTFSGNVADTYWACILINNGSVTVSNSTFYNNSAASQGGGIFTFGSLTLTNQTSLTTKPVLAAPCGLGSGGSINSINSLFVKGAVTTAMAQRPAAAITILPMIQAAAQPSSIHLPYCLYA